MYAALISAPAFLAGWLLWRELGRRGLPRPMRIVLAALGTALGFALIFWGWVYLSILLFQWNDPVAW